MARYNVAHRQAQKNIFKNVLVPSFIRARVKCNYWWQRMLLIRSSVLDILHKPIIKMITMKSSQTSCGEIMAGCRFRPLNSREKQIWKEHPQNSLLVLGT